MVLSNMKLTLLSDTHGRHHEITLPAGDILFHGGDITKMGKHDQIIDFCNWFASQDYKNKIFIAGNHDFLFETIEADHLTELIPKDIIYLNDSGITIEGLKIWGSPVQPWFGDWALGHCFWIECGGLLLVICNRLIPNSGAQTKFEAAA